MLLVKQTLWKYNLNFVKDVPTTCVNFIINIIAVLRISYRPLLAIVTSPCTHACYSTNIQINHKTHLTYIQMHAVAQLVEALRYKPEGRGFSS